MKSIFRINLLICFFSILAFVSVNFSPAYLSILGFLSYGIPFLIILNIIFLLFWSIATSKKALFSLITLFTGYPFLAVTFNFEKKVEENLPYLTFNLLSYNVKCFNSSLRKGQKSKENFDRIIDDLTGKNGNIVCLQEYCSYNAIPAFNAEKKIKESGYKFFYSQRRKEHGGLENVGIATFSKYPIINKGNVVNRNNIIAIFTDHLIHNDTLRVYNVHLYSMGIKYNSKSNYSFLERILQQIKIGFENKALEIDELITHASGTPHKVIFAGDFNEIPYSYVYFRMRKTYRNSFESAGTGFGVTYNGKIPGLRIDHQFANNQLKILDHQVLKHMNITDHYPIFVTYSIK